MGKSLLERLRPALQGARSIQWPGPVPEGMERPTITLHCLNAPSCEDAYLGAIAHFRARKATVRQGDPIFNLRERSEVLWRAARDAEGQPLAASVDQLEQELAPEMRNVLWLEWAAVQAEFSTGPHSEAELRELVEGLKGNFPVERLEGWPSSWLLQLLRISVAPSSKSPTDS